MSRPPRLFLTCMSGPGQIENMIEMVEPILGHIDGVIWALVGAEIGSPSSRYLETVKGAGEVLRQSPATRLFHRQNSVLCSGKLSVGDFILLGVEKKRFSLDFVKRVKTEIGLMMAEAEVSALFYNGLPLLLRNDGTAQYVQASSNPCDVRLIFTEGRAIDWSKIQPNNREVVTEVA